LGVPETQAKGMTEAQADAFKDFSASRELATKNDLLELKHELLKWIIGIALKEYGDRLPFIATIKKNGSSCVSY